MEREAGVESIIICQITVYTLITWPVYGRIPVSEGQLQRFCPKMPGGVWVCRLLGPSWGPRS